MLASFLDLPAELRNEIYKQILVCREPINPWNRKYNLVPNLLLTNSMILHETSSLLYGNNCFDLAAWSPDITSEFLDTIGLTNASRLERIRINFPGFDNLKDEIRLEEESLNTLNKIQAYCTNLKSITMTPPTIYLMEIQLASVSCGRALALVAAHFKAITSLREIVVEIYEDGSNSDIISQMQNHGWTLKTVERVEEEEWDDDRCWGETDEDDHLYNYEDDYDIDNNSDFWRRAAD